MLNWKKSAGLLLLQLLFSSSLALAHEDPRDLILQITEEIHADPNRADLILHRGDLRLEVGDWENALKDYELVARLSPDSVEARLGRALAFEKGRKDSQALKALDDFLKQHPATVNSLSARARILEREGSYDRAVLDLKNAIQLQPDPDFYLRCAAMQERSGSLKLALATLEDGLKRMGSVITLELAALNLEERAGWNDAALLRIDRLSSGQSRQESWMLRRALIYERIGDRTLASEACSLGLQAIEQLSPYRRETAAMLQLREQLLEIQGRVKQP